jgi:NitT/TauT family transport system substrate-binding protein
MTSLPMYLNVRGDKLKKLEDFTNADKIAMTAIKASISAIVMQMDAAEKYGLPEATRFDKFHNDARKHDVSVRSGCWGMRRESG